MKTYNGFSGFKWRDGMVLVGLGVGLRVVVVGIYIYRILKRNSFLACCCFLCIYSISFYIYICMVDSSLD